MWNILKSDFEELVSAVREDTNYVRERVVEQSIAKKQSALAQESQRRIQIPESFTVPLEVQADEDPEMKGRIEDYRKTFNIQERTEDISRLIQENDDLKEQFETLVPQIVRFEDFWERYFFRCDEESIQIEWDLEEERTRLARAQLVDNVSTFLGKTVQTLSKGVASALVAEENLEDDEDEVLVPAAAFGTAARPPFVRNTATDEKDDDDEEEEIGWSDDEENEEDQEEAFTGSRIDTDSNPDSSEQIEFHDKATEMLKEQVKQITEERDQLHDTVEMQKREIAHLRALNDEQIEKLHSHRKEAQGNSGSEEAMDTAKANEAEAQMTEKIKCLLDLVAAKEQELCEKTRIYEQNQNEQEALISTLRSRNKDLLQKLDDALNAEPSPDGFNDTTVNLQNENGKLQKELADRNEKMKTLEAENSAMQRQLAAASLEIEKLKADFLTVSTKLQFHQNAESPSIHPALEEASACKESSPGISDSGVKVDKSIVSKILETDNDGDEDGWGDDWD
jgi:hypothetical protein